MDSRVDSVPEFAESMSIESGAGGLTADGTPGMTRGSDGGGGRVTLGIDEGCGGNKEVAAAGPVTGGIGVGEGTCIAGVSVSGSMLITLLIEPS